MFSMVGDMRPSETGVKSGGLINRLLVQVQICPVLQFSSNEGLVHEFWVLELVGIVDGGLV